MRYFIGLCVLAMLLSGNANAKGFYIGGYGGANWSQIEFDTPQVQVESEVGYVMGAVVGTSIDSLPGVRIEADLNYRSNDLRTFLFGNGYVVTDETWALLGNIVYDIPVKVGGLHPYALAGIGYGSRTVAIDYTPLAINNTGLAWQAAAGVRTEIADGVHVGVEYRYFDAPDFDALTFGGYHDAGSNHSLIASVNFAFN